MPLNLSADQKILGSLVDRRHPQYVGRLAHWQFCRATYDGGRDWFGANIFRYLKEGRKEYKDRVTRAYRFNHTREVVRLVTKYIFKSGVIRNTEEAPKEIKSFWGRATARGAEVNELMRRGADLASIYGRVWFITDSQGADDAITIADAKNAKVRVYGYLVTPEDMLDYAFDERGKLVWALWRITHRDDADPLRSTGKVFPRYILYTTDSFAVIDESRDADNKRVLTVSKTGENPLGYPPCYSMDEQESDDPNDSPALITDIAYLDRAIANYLSNLDAIIQDQTFSQLVIPAQALLPGEDNHKKLLEIGTNRIFVYDGEGGRAPAYISPDAAQAQVLLNVVNKIIGEIYHSIGMAGERTKQDNAVGIDNSSGVAKAYDFERVNSLLTSKAQALERAESAIIDQVADWLGIELPKDEENAGEAKDLVKYPDSFDVRGLYDEFEVAENLSLLEAPEEVRREQMRMLVGKLFPRMSKTKMDLMEKGIAEWPPQPVDLAVDTNLTSSQRSDGAIGSLRKSSKPPTPAEGEGVAKPRQGQVTSETKSKTKTAAKPGA